MKAIHSAAGIVLALTMGAADAQMNVAITAPMDGSTVGVQPIVEGTVSDPKATVWVIVHPLEVSTYWVQPRLTVRENGSWKVQINIGRNGTIDVGKLFEIRAVANSSTVLREGMELEQWPEASAISPLVEVRRK